MTTTIIILAIVAACALLYYGLLSKTKEESKWLPCWACRRHWRENEHGRIEYWEPMVWEHPAEKTDSLCPECRYRALKIVNQIEQEAM